GRIEPRVRLVDGHDVRGAVEPRAHDGRQPDGPSTDYGDDIPGRHLPVEHADLVTGRQDVGQHEQGLVTDAGGRRIRRCIRKRHAHILRLRAVDQVAEDPATAAETLTVVALATESTRAAGGDAGHQHLVANAYVLHAGAHFFDRANGLVAEDAAVG